MATYDDELQAKQFIEGTRSAYPYIPKDTAIVYTPSVDPKEHRYLEFYPKGEKGTLEDGYRPDSLPLDKVGIQVIKPTTRSIDVLADYVSHYAVNEDPKLKKMYEEFDKSVDPKKMKERYAYHSSKDRGEDRETRPYEEWKKTSGLPELFRGYTFRQWGEDSESKKYYTPEQLKILDKVRAHVGVK